MNKLIIGSTAIKHYFPDFPRTPKDLDYVVENKAKFKRTEGIEYLDNPVILKHQSEGYLSPELMISLKVSHLLWDVNWEKHMFDLQFLLKKGYKWDLDLVRELRVYWNETLPKIRRSKLEQSKEEFFTNAVNMDTHEHDFLHTILAEIPAYTKILKDGCEVELDEREEFGLAPIVHEEGDREGGGNYSCVVRHFTEHDVYIEVTGYYSSYNGTDWDGGFEIVRPVEKTGVVYE